MIIGFLILISQYMFIDPSSGSLISGSIRLFKSVVNSARVSMGKKKPFRGTEILKVKTRWNNRISRWECSINVQSRWATSLTAFPEEVMAQESKSIQYQNTRDRSLAEIKSLHLNLRIRKDNSKYEKYKNAKCKE